MESITTTADAATTDKSLQPILVSGAQIEDSFSSTHKNESRQKKVSTTDLPFDK
jgi:hypothetical protein